MEKSIKFIQRINFFWVFFAVILLYLSLYLYGLDKVPVHLNQDEAMFALNAKSIAESGHDFYGNSLPFYFWHLDNFWATPVITYWTSIFLKIVPFTEIGIRVPTVFFGLITVLSLMLLSHEVFKNKHLTFLSGVLITLSPGLLINSRMVIDNVYPLLFVVLWLLFIYKKNYLLAGIALGIGIHSYHASKIYMPMYLITTLLYGYMTKWLNSRTFFIAVLGFLIPILLFIPWLVNHPDTLISQVSYVSSVDPHFVNRPIHSRLIQFAENYLSYFDPKVLFMDGDKTLIHSTQRVGVFLFPMVFLIVFGVLHVITDKKESFGKLILFGFLTFPLAPALINDPGRVSRALVVIPFGVLLAIYGVKFLLVQKQRAFRYLVILIFFFSVFQFFNFLNDYYGDYRLRSREVLNNDVGGAFESALRSTKIRPVKTIYVDKSIFQARYYFEFYKRKLNIYPPVVVYFDSNKEGIKSLHLQSVVVSNKIFTDLGKFEVIETIRELDGVETYFVYFNG